MKIQIETFELEGDVQLFSKEDVIKIIVVKKKEILVLIENMQLYYNSAKNQVTKNIQNRMLQTISHEFGTYLSILFSHINAALYDTEVTQYVKGM